MALLVSQVFSHICKHCHILVNREMVIFPNLYLFLDWCFVMVVELIGTNLCIYAIEG